MLQSTCHIVLFVYAYQFEIFLYTLIPTDKKPNIILVSWGLESRCGHYKYNNCKIIIYS